MAENVYWKTNQEKDVLSFLFCKYYIYINKYNDKYIPTGIANWKTNQENDVLSFLFVRVITNAKTDSPAFCPFNILLFEILNI